MREIRQSGLEGGGAVTIRLSLPLSTVATSLKACRVHRGPQHRETGTRLWNRFVSLFVKLAWMNDTTGGSCDLD